MSDTSRNNMNDNSVEDPDRVSDEVFLAVIDGVLQWTTVSDVAADRHAQEGGHEHD